jgi:biotin carboxyl carrier protein
MKLSIDEETFDVVVKPDWVSVNGQDFPASLAATPPYLTITINGRPFKALVKSLEGSQAIVNVDGKEYTVHVEGLGQGATRAASPRTARAHGHSGLPGTITAMLPGRVVRILVNIGDPVEIGSVLLILEAMKMENEIHSNAAGTVKAIHVAPGQSVVAGQPLIEIDS